MRKLAHLAAAVIVVATAFAIDQLTKVWALSNLSDGRDVELGLGASLRLVFNPGVAFGLGGDVGAPLVIGVIVLVIGLLTWIVVRVLQGRNAAATVFLAVAAGGAIGNLWDRATRSQNGPLSGEVVDFIAVDWFAIFNVADIFTTLGLLGWAMMFLFQREHVRTPAVATDGTLDGQSRR